MMHRIQTVCFHLHGLRSLLTNAATGSPASDCGVVVVLRHDAIAYAFEDRLWSTYKFGETFKAEDPKTKAPATRNPFGCL